MLRNLENMLFTERMKSIVCVFCLLAAGLSIAGLFVPSISVVERCANYQIMAV